MKQQYKYILSLIFYLFVILTVSAQIGTFRNINSGGIVDFQANCFHKDSKGFIWTGGSYKIQRFDGQNFVIYDIPEGVRKVNTLNESNTGIIYAGTSNGILTLNDSEKVFNLILPEQLSQNVYSLYIDSLNVVYAGTESGLAMITDGVLETIKIQNENFPFNQVLSILKPTIENQLWLLTPGGPVSFNPKTRKLNHYPVLRETYGSYCTAFAMIDSKLYIGTNGSGIFVFETASASIVPFLHVGNGTITCLGVCNNSQVFAGTAGTGVFEISTRHNKVLQTYNANAENEARLSSAMVTSLLVDDFGILWVGSYEHLGFDYIFLDPKPFMIYRTPSFSTLNVPINKFYLGDTFKLLTGLNGLYYISNTNGNVHFFEVGTGKAEHLKPGLVNSIISFHNKLLFGGECGIYTFDPSNLSLDLFEISSDIQDATIFDLNIAPNQSLWIASSKGLTIIDTKTKKASNYNTVNSNLPNDNVRFVYFDSQQQTWICTDRGICFWDCNEKNFYLKEFETDFIDKQRVHFIMEDRKGNFIFCYDERNVLFTDSNLKNQRRICTEENAGFTGLRILKVLQDKNGTFWFVGSRGTFKANEALTNYELYSISEGLYEPYATDGHLDANDKIWLSNNKGLYYSTDNFKRYNAPLEITDIKVNGISRINEFKHSIKNEKPLILKNHENNITFQFAYLDYTRPDLMVYECHLSGVDDWWHFLRGIDSKAYKDLLPGEYEFTVQHNMNTHSTRKVLFVIKPFISKAGIVGIIVLLAGLTVIITISVSSRIKSAQAKKQLKPKPEEQKYQFNKISKEKADLVIIRLKECMNDKQMYLNVNLKMTDLANEISCSNQVLSQVFSLFIKEKYNEYINRYRIDEFKRIVTSTDHSKYTLKTLAQRSGFSSYTSFYRAFKDTTGTTPNEYIQNYME